MALLSEHPCPMYGELAVVSPVSPSIANLFCIPKAASLQFSYFVITLLSMAADFFKGDKTGRTRGIILKTYRWCPLRTSSSHRRVCRAKIESQSPHFNEDSQSLSPSISSSSFSTTS
ncbi:Bgt-20177 [Blumeria graminis f. sp. tritici]|uniref:Bgt-20177 n=1 Tax=Blumeria graminis f. sp. tritici TaxID=62690 RepID=A0A9X9L6Z2_BLUGR|nr:Bgt-20177 [Blumeria graminis f. sp. tritici]